MPRNTRLELLAPLSLSLASISKAALILAICTLFAACFEILETRSRTHDDAKPLIAAGWLPTWLPSQSTEIYEAHDIDTNAVIARFLPNILEKWIPTHCTESHFSELATPQISAVWWNMEEFGNNKFSDSFQAYDCRNAEFLAIHRTKNVAYYWTGIR